MSTLFNTLYQLSLIAKNCTNK